MKKLILFLIILLYPIFSFASIDERKTDICFANGIDTEKADVKYNAEEILAPAIQTELYGGSETEMKKHISKVSYAYNSTNSLISDGIETIYQKFGWVGLSDLFNASHGTDLKIQVTAYQNSIKSGHKVLVVAHSQGNLFTKEAYVELGKQSKGAWMQNYLM